jgi:hypothetical protein
MDNQILQEENDFLRSEVKRLNTENEQLKAIVDFADARINGYVAKERGQNEMRTMPEGSAVHGTQSLATPLRGSLQGSN